MKTKCSILQQNIKWNCISAAILFYVLFCSSALLQVEASSDSDLSVQFFYTCDGDVKANRYFSIEAAIKNEGSEFSGRLQVILPGEKNSDSIALEKPISIKSGEEVSEKITLYLDSELSFIQVQLIDSKEKVIVSKKKKLFFAKHSDTLYVGSFSNRPELLGYLGDFYQASENAKNFSLAEHLPPEEEKEYDMYDVIIVNDYDLTRLNQKQIEALKKWIENGGSFILGADSYMKTNLALFANELSVKNISNIRFGRTNLGLSSEDMEQIRDNIIDKDRRIADNFSLNPLSVERRDVSIEGACILQADNEGILFQEISYGKGVVQAAGMNLALNPKNWNGMGTGLLHMIYNNVSDNKAVQLNRESYSFMHYPIYKSIAFKEKRTNYPIAKYIIVYILYFSIIGPFLYVVLKKKDRRELYWLFVPAASLLFTVIIIIMGSSTRIADQYIGYFSMLTMDESGTGNKEILFMAESAEHKKYQFITEKDAEIMPMFNYTDQDTDKDQEVSEEYKMLLRMEEDQTVCKMNGYASFETAYFRLNQPLVGAKPDHKLYQSNVDLKQGRPEGTIITDLGYDLENACILTGNTVTAIGTVKDGLPIRIKNQKSQRLSSQSDLYSSKTEVSSILQEVTGHETASPVLSDEEYKKYSRFQLLSYYMEQNIHTSGSYLIGFSEKPINQTVKNSNIVMDGENLVILPLSMNDAWANQAGILSLDAYKSIRKGYWNLENRLISSNSLHIMYTLPENIKINQIHYTEQYNGTFNTQEKAGFFGKIHLFNNRTQVYDEIFTGQTEGVLADINDYVNSHNQIRAIYQQDTDKSSILPILSAAVDGRMEKDADH